MPSMHSAAKFRAAATLLLLVGGFTACGNPVSTAKLSPAAERGRQYFAAYCSACHNAINPFADGIQGPGVAGASLELLEAKVLRGQYPPGYEPKRAGPVVMPPQPLLQDKLPDIAAFLGEIEKPR